MHCTFFFSNQSTCTPEGRKYVSVVSPHFALWGPLQSAVRDGPAPNLLCVFQVHPRLSFQSCRCKQGENMGSASISTWTHSPHFHLDLFLILTTSIITFRVCFAFFKTVRLSASQTAFDMSELMWKHTKVFMSLQTRVKRPNAAAETLIPCEGSDKVTLTQDLQSNSLLQFSLACPPAKVWSWRSTQLLKGITEFEWPTCNIAKQPSIREHPFWGWHYDGSPYPNSLGLQDCTYDDCLTIKPVPWVQSN